MMSLSDAGPPLIELQEVTRSFNGSQILKPTSLKVAPGEYLAITGPSGSGKSTLLNLLGLLDRQSTGSILVKGEKIDQLPDDVCSAIRGQTIGFVFQAFQLLDNRTAIQNVELGMLYQNVPAPLRHSRAIEALRKVGLDHRLEASPTTMSGGEQQRVAIARAIAANVDLLLADEPTGNLDSETGEKVLELFDEMQATGMALITVTHNTEVSTRASTQYTMSDGVLTQTQTSTT
jgi:putative ABC transport system ATP-binding protein